MISSFCHLWPPWMNSKHGNHLSALTDTSHTFYHHKSLVGTSSTTAFCSSGWPVGAVTVKYSQGIDYTVAVSKEQGWCEVSAWAWYHRVSFHSVSPTLDYCIEWHVHVAHGAWNMSCYNQGRDIYQSVLSSLKRLLSPSVLLTCAVPYSYCSVPYLSITFAYIHRIRCQ